MANNKNKVLIAGGGIGGITALLALRQRGIDAELFEQAAAFGQVGAGLQVSGNATKILRALGLGEALAKVAYYPQGRDYRAWDSGDRLYYTPLGERAEQRFGAPYYTAHRADLLDVLLGGLGAKGFRLGCRIERFEQDDNGVTLFLADGSTATGDVLIGADGIHSTVRGQMFGAELPRYTGNVAWRGLVPAERIKHLGIEVASHNWMGPDGHVVHYWVAAGRLMNVVCVVEHGTWTSESWTDKGDVAEVLARYDGWHPIVRGLIKAFPETFIWALHDRLPLPRWSDGRVTLLGDACHPMLPMMAQGAAQSIEDGAALAALLTAMPGDVPGVLRRYEELRKPRATRLQEASAANRTRFHLPDGPEQQQRDASMAVSGDRSIANIGWLYSHDAAAVV